MCSSFIFSQIYAIHFMLLLLFLISNLYLPTTWQNKIYFICGIRLKCNAHISSNLLYIHLWFQLFVFYIETIFYVCYQLHGLKLLWLLLVVRRDELMFLSRENKLSFFSYSQFNGLQALSYKYVGGFVPLHTDCLESKN